jgi:hypothetical protein
MKRLAILVLLVAAPLLAEEVTLKQAALLKSGRNAVSLKPGAVVELISRDGAEITIKYKELTGKIPANKLDEPKPAPASSTPSAPPAKTSKAKKPEQKPAPPPPADKKLVENPQTGYGKAVKKAQDAAAAHDKNVLKPKDEVLNDR